jgi:hypothetical protein
MINCFFCQINLAQEPDPGEITHYACTSCSNKPPVYNVLTTYKRSMQEVTRGHLYLTLNDKKYHIRCVADGNKTEISCKDDEELVMTVPGFPITPNNAEQKLKLYLTFL